MTLTAPLPTKVDKKQMIETFMMEPVIYETAPPEPLPFPKTFKISLDPTRHYAHRITPAFLNATKPLLTSCDLGLPI